MNTAYLEMTWLVSGQLPSIIENKRHAAQLNMATKSQKNVICRGAFGARVPPQPTKNHTHSMSIFRANMTKVVLPSCVMHGLAPLHTLLSPPRTLAKSAISICYFSQLDQYFFNMSAKQSIQQVFRVNLCNTDTTLSVKTLKSFRNCCFVLVKATNHCPQAVYF